MNESNSEYLFSDVDYLDTWKAMEEVYKKGLVKAIGVSNFNSVQIQRIIDNATVVPAVNQVITFNYSNIFFNSLIYLGGVSSISKSEQAVELLQRTRCFDYGV